MTGANHRQQGQEELGAARGDWLQAAREGSCGRTRQERGRDLVAAVAARSAIIFLVVKEAGGAGAGAEMAELSLAICIYIC
jgi:hypothetical protein